MLTYIRTSIAARLNIALNLYSTGGSADTVFLVLLLSLPVCALTPKFIDVHFNSPGIKNKKLKENPSFIIHVCFSEGSKDFTVVYAS